MEEKKLTDEEILKELINESNRGEWCDISFIDCVEVRVLKNALDLINRQKAKIERLTEWKDKLQDTKDELEQQLIDTGFKEYCEENKRLTEENAELQKQVEELNKVVTNLKYTHLQDECKLADLISTCKQSFRLSDEWKAKFEQAVKDTAKEIFAKVKDVLNYLDKEWEISNALYPLEKEYGV